METQLYRVIIRRDLAPVKPEAEVLDGKEYYFSPSFTLDESDFGGIYAGEKAMLPYDDRYPATGPVWIASGDLVIINK